MRIQFRKVNGFQRYHEVYEWQPNGSQKWYQVHRNNILALEGYDGEREIFNQVLAGATLSLEALYLRTSKLLLITERA